MSDYTILSLAQSLQADIGLRVQDTIVGNRDVTARGLLKCIYDAGDDLALAFEWGRLIQSNVPLAVPIGNGLAPLPPDFLRLIPGASVLGPSGEPIEGGISDSQFVTMLTAQWEGWEHAQYRVLQDVIQFAPAPIQSGSLKVSYVSKFWIESVSGTRLERAAADTDKVLIPYREMLSYAQNIFNAKKGLSTSYSQTRVAQSLPLGSTANRGSDNGR